MLGFGKKLLEAEIEVQRETRMRQETPIPELKRIAVPVLDEQLNEARVVLGEEAKSILGYTALSSQNAAEVGRNEVAKLFQELDIEVLDTESVKSYQKFMLDKAREGKTPTQYSNPIWLSTWLSVTPNEAMVGARAYTKPIPEFVLSRAIEIKKRLPEARFWVESLEETPLQDPFMVLSYKGSTYYIDVWDEPTFEGRRVK